MRFQSAGAYALVGQVGRTPRVDFHALPQDFNDARFSGVLGQSSGHVIAHGQKTLWVGALGSVQARLVTTHCDQTDLLVRGGNSAQHRYHI